ncbi:MAG: type III secretion system export apparatus subunit SctU [Pseudomonadota bacterium]
MSGEKTEKATPKKLREARKKGQLPFSKDLNSIFIFLAGIAITFASAGKVATAFKDMFEKTMMLTANDQLKVATLTELVKDTFAISLLAVTPLLASVVVIGVGVGIVQTKGNVSAHPLKPDLNKLNPLSKLKQWFSPKGLIEFAKTLLKLAFVIAVAYIVVYAARKTIVRLLLVDPETTMAFVGTLAKRFLYTVAGLFLAISVIDMLIQRWQFMKDQRMSKDEIKREYKNSEGDPHIKGKRKQMHRQMSQQAAKKTVAKADAVLVNPTHLAICIEYDRQSTDMPAPTVTLKGADAYAQRMIRYARMHNVPVVQDVPLARTLYSTVEEEDIVPPDLYAAVAEILAFVYGLQKAQRAQHRVWRVKQEAARRRAAGRRRRRSAAAPSARA